MEMCPQRTPSRSAQLGLWPKLPAIALPPLREVTAGRPLGGLSGRGAAPGAGVHRCLLDERAHEGRDARAHSVLAQSLVGSQKWQP